MTTPPTLTQSADRWRRRVFAILFILAVLLLTAGLTTVRAAVGSSIVEHPVPGSPKNLVVEAPGRVWFTMPAENQLGRLVVTSPTDVVFTPFPLPNAASEPYDLAYADGLIWFTEKAGNRIGKLDTATGAITEFAIPTANAQPTGIDVAPNGNVWFVEQAADKLAMFNPVNTNFTEVAVPAVVEGTAMESVAVADNLNIWLTAPDANLVPNYRADRGTWSLTSTESFLEKFDTPVDVIIDPSGRPWTTATDSNVLGRFIGETLSSWRWFDAPSDDAGPSKMAIRNAGSQWYVFFTETRRSSVAMLQVRASDIQLRFIADVPLPTANGAPWGIDVDEDGHVWIAGSGSNVIAEWQAPYFQTLYLPSVRER